MMEYDTSPQMTAITLREVIEATLSLKGYHQFAESDPAYWQSPDGDVDKLIPMVIDCLERESWN